MKSIEQQMIEMVDLEKLERTVAYLTDNCVSDINMRQYLDNWAANKKHIFQLFGNKLTCEKNVTYSIEDNYRAAREIINDFVKEALSGPSFALCRHLLDSITPVEVKNNILNRDFYIMGLKINKGEKISKILPRLALGIDNKQKERIVTKYSMLIQDFSAKGVAVISIDPIDYVTMSQNTSGWSSCHALDGCYRTGTLAYLQDNATTISYVQSSKPAVFRYAGDEYSYSNKTWRQIVSFSHKTSYAIQARQYPNMNNANQTTIANMVSDLFKNKTGIDYKDHEVEVGYRLAELHCSWDSSELYYNDIEHEAFDLAYIIAPQEDFDFSEFHKAKYYEENDVCQVGHSVRCLCGFGDYLEDEAEYLFTEGRYNDYDDYDDYEDEDY